MELHQYFSWFLQNEVSILHVCAATMMITGSIVYIILLFIPATYGRYSNTGGILSYPIPSHLGWFFQEIPAFAVSLTLVMLVNTGYLPGEYSSNQLIVLACFVAHYFQR